jgi:protein-tyrosine phosphatase
MKVVFVDAGNYCRSPAAEAVARALIAEAGLAGRIAVSSAGLKDKHVGDTADPRTIEALTARGYRLEGFRCREIAAADFDADVILAMDRDNLTQLEARKPAGARARLALFLDPEEVPDPYYGAEDGFGAMMDLIEGGVRRRLAAWREGP